jgi:hypothetical protein
MVLEAICPFPAFVEVSNVVSDCRRLSIYKHGYIDLVTIGIYKSPVLRSSFKHDRGRQYSIEVGSTLSRQAVLY